MGVFIFTNMHIALYEFALEGLTIDEIGFLVRLRQICEQAGYTQKGGLKMIFVPLTLEQIAAHCGIHVNTVKKLRKSLVEKGALKHEQVFHENGSCVGNVYDSGLTFRM